MILNENKQKYSQKPKISRENQLFKKYKDLNLSNNNRIYHKYTEDVRKKIVKPECNYHIGEETTDKNSYYTINHKKNSFKQELIENDTITSEYKNTKIKYAVREKVSGLLDVIQNKKYSDLLKTQNIQFENNSSQNFNFDRKYVDDKINYLTNIIWRDGHKTNYLKYSQSIKMNNSKSDYSKTSFISSNAKIGNSLVQLPRIINTRKENENENLFNLSKFNCKKHNSIFCEDYSK
jgi:hypothetical protein